MVAITIEEAMKIIPPADVIEKINEFVTVSGKGKEKIKSAFYKTLAHKSLDGYADNDERCRNAMYILIAQLKARMPSEGSAPMFPMEFNVFAMTGISTMKTKGEKLDPITQQKVKTTEEKKLAKVYGVFTGVESNDPNVPPLPPKLGILTMWGDACQVLQQLKKGCSFTGKFSVKTFDDHYDLSLNNYEKMTEIPNTLPPAKDIITKFFTPFPVSQVAYNIGQLKLMKGRIVKGYQRLTKNGDKTLGYTIIEDAQLELGSAKPGEKTSQSVMWSNSPEFATEYGAGTECYIMASITNTSETYGLSAFGDFIIPITEVNADLAAIFDEDIFGDDTPESAPVAPPAWDAPTTSAPQPTQPSVPSPASNTRW
jgi:hypothetical protein